MNEQGLSYDFKQDIELFFYFLANGTLCRDHTITYQINLQKDPSLFREAVFLFIDNLESIEKDKKINEKVRDFIVSNATLGLPPIIKSLSPIDCLRRLVITISEIEIDLFRELMISANDLQLTICVWGNNIQINENGQVTNDVHARNRSLELLYSMYTDKSPTNEFADWELEHNT